MRKQGEYVGLTWGEEVEFLITKIDSARSSRRRRRANRSNPWRAVIYREIGRGEREPVADNEFRDRADARVWLHRQLEALRFERLGDEHCLCYLGVLSAGGRDGVRARLFSTTEPIEWATIEGPVTG